MATNVNRESLEYKVGWLEALWAFGNRLFLEVMRAKKSEVPGMYRSFIIAKEMWQSMADQLKQDAVRQEQAPEPKEEQK